MSKKDSINDSLLDNINEQEVLKSLPLKHKEHLESIFDKNEEVIKVRNDLSMVVDDKPHLVHPSEDKLRRLLKIRKYNKLQKFFHSMHEGSLRKIVLLMVRMTVGVGILTLPSYLKNFGGVLGIFVLSLAAFISYLVYSFIVDVSNETGIYDYVLLTKLYCNKYVQSIFRYTYFIDVFSMPILITILSWNIVEYLMAFSGIAKDDWYTDISTYTFNEYHPIVWKIRLVYCVAIYLIMLPFMFKKDLGSLQKVGNIFLVFLLFLCLVILIEMPFFEINLSNSNLLKVEYLAKKPDFQWFESFFSILLSYYCQPYYFGIRNELMHPTKRRLKKLVKYSMSTILFFFILIAFVCYICLGDNYTPSLVILRKAYDGKSKWSEIFFQISIMFFFLVSILSMPLFNPPIRDYILVEFKFEKTPKNYRIWSTVPFLIACLICFAYPTIIGIFNIFGITVFNFNG
jgi:amino acid permease